MKEQKIYYYNSYNEDFAQSKNQNYKLNENYKWIHNGKLYKVWSRFLYEIFHFSGAIYCKVFLHVKIENKKILKKYKNQGYILYGNHTLPIGDVFIPASITYSKRSYYIASSANLGIAGFRENTSYYRYTSNSRKYFKNEGIS